MLYLITHELRKTPDAAHVQLAAALEKGGAVRVQQSAWLYSANQLASEVLAVVASYIDPDDSVLVVGLTGAAGWRNLLLGDATVDMASVQTLLQKAGWIP